MLEAAVHFLLGVLGVLSLAFGTLVVALLLMWVVRMLVEDMWEG